MPFSLPDLKRSYGNSGTRGGAPDVRPYLLSGKELDAQCETLRRTIEWFEQRVGERRDAFSQDELAQLVGDYRLARCLTSCLQTSFAFRAPEFEQVVHAATGDVARAVWHRFQEAGISSAADLRLHVFDAVNQRNGGYATPEERQPLLDDLAASFSCTGEHLQALLWCDAEANERLERITPSPAPEQLAAHYNRRALDTLLVRCLDADLFLPSPDGAAIRQFYWTVKRSGLLCELSLHDPEQGPRDGVWAHLFGPLEIFGPRTRHGDRFARAVLDLIDALPEIQGSARVLINEREYVLRLPRGLLAATADEDPESRPDEISFDSGIERHLFQTLRGMERTDDTYGWSVEREPEPIVHGPTVLVPDFALQRTDGRRVFVEVIGFWTPAYRERKKAKLLALKESVDLVLVVQADMAADFATLPYPVLPYKRRPSGHDLVTLLRRRYPPTASASPARRDRPAGG